MSGSAGCRPPRDARLSVAGGLLCAALFVACGSAEPEAALQTTIDTVAGAVHVRHTGRAAEWRPGPALTLGEVGGLADAQSPEEFGRIARVVADEAGRIYVADQRPPEIRVFGPDGEHLRTLGRQGAGPGELGGLHGMAWLAPDTMLVMDPENARLTRMTARGEHLGQWGWARLSGASDQFLFNGGEREAYAYVLTPGSEGGRLGSVWVRYTLDGAPDTLRIPTEETLGVALPSNVELCRGGERIGAFSNPYAPSLIRLPAPGLERAVALNTDYRIAFLDAADDTVRVISRDVPRIPLPDSVRAAVEADHAEFRNDWRGADCEGEIARPDYLPVLRELFFDHHGRLLVEYNRSEGVAFDLFDGDGRWIATFPAPDRDTAVPPYLYNDRLYTVTRDRLDVQRVRVDRLTQPDEQASEEAAGGMMHSREPPPILRIS